MRPDERSLYSAILADPDDDTVRLAYADWLDENGQSERAEFIRVQIELARLGSVDIHLPAILGEQYSLSQLEAHGGANRCGDTN